MEELRSSGAALSRKLPNGSSASSAAASSAYDDVFGGPPRYSGPFAARLSDFSEIFGGLASSCSIPVLDLPPALDGYEVPADARSSGFDYSEIFGGFDGGGFGASYEELVAEREGAEAESRVQEALASNGRAPKDTKCGQQVTGVSKTSPNGANNESMACLEKDQISSDSTHLHGGAKQFHTSYHKTSRGNIEDVISEQTHITQLHAVPGFTFDVETRPPLLHIRSGNSPNMVTGDLSLNAGLKEGINDTKQGEIFSPSSSAANTKSSGNDLKMDHKQFVTECPASEDDPSNLKHHSRSSSNYSTSSGDVYYPDVTYLTVSDISLRTQPLRVPPPSRPPPKVANNQGNPKMTIYANSRVDLGEGSLSKLAVDHHKLGGWGAPKRNAPQVAVNDSFCFFDVEVDARSAAAASAAAMKEAMEQAEARLKSAKESMERKRDSLSRKKLGQYEGTKHKVEKEDKIPQEARLFSEVVTEKNLVQEDEMKNEYVLEERQKVRGAAKVAPDREEKESHVVSDQHRQTMRGNEFKSCHAYKLNEGHGEWKTDTQFYELVNNEKKFRVIREVSDEECAEKKPKATTKVNIEKENVRKEAQLTYEFERNGNLWEVNETSENEENSRKSRASNMTGMQEEIKELSNTIPGEKKPKATTKVNIEKGHVRKEAQLTYEFESNGNLWEVNETPEKDENSRKSRANNMTGMEEKIKELSNTIPGTCVQEQTIGKTEVIYGFHQPEKNGKLGEAQEAHIIVEEARKINSDEDARVCGESEKKLESSYEDCKLEGVCESEDKESKLEAANVFCGCEDGEELIRSFATCQPHECEKKLKLANKTGLQDVSEKETEVTCGSCIWEASEKVEAAQVPTQCENSETSGKATLECCYEENKNKLKETCLAPEQEEGEIISRTEEACILVENELKHKVAQEDNELEVNLEKLKASGTIGCRENDKIVVVEEARRQDYNKMKTREAKLQGQQNDKNQNAGQVPFELENNEELIVAELDRGKKEDGYIKEVHVAIDLKENHKMFNAARDVFQMTVKRDFKDVQEARLLEKKINILSSAQDNSDCRTVVTENITDRRRREERENERRVERERKQEQENTRKLEEKEREREREKDRLAVERATREARERAYAEARDRAERIAVERVTAEARQRALAEAREKAERASAEALERASAEALEKALAEKASREARLRVERAAVERATAEARERAVERALAEKAAADARERTEKLNGSSWERMRKDNGTEEHFRDRDKGDGGARDMQDFPHSARFQSAGSSNSGQRHSDSYNHGDGESALRCKARLERHQRTVERAANALAEKNLRDKLAQREQAERNRLAETLDADVRRWSNGKEGNLRALLSTLQYILGSESGWQPIPLTDVITAAAVKKAYRKATLCVHPDKLQQRGASIQQKYICEKVFDLLKEAWNRFNSEER